MGAVTMFLMAASMAAAPVPIDFQNLMSPDDYPTDSLIKGDEGVVRFAVTISADGVPTACTVAQGSGSEFLDATTCSLLTHRAHFKPAQDEKGKPIVAVYRGNLRWQLPVDPKVPAATPPKPQQPGKVDLALAMKKLPEGVAAGTRLSLNMFVSEKGKIEQCWPGHSTTLPDNIQKDACKQFTSQFKPAPAADPANAPIRSMQTALVSISAAQ